MGKVYSKYREENTWTVLRHIPLETETLWCKLDHLLYLPILDLTRPRDLYYDQGQGLGVLYGFTYKYLTMEHFLGQMTRLKIGFPLANDLARTYTQAWYPGQSSLYLFPDWHVKPHWTKEYVHAGHVTMWGRTMPGTKQLILNGPKGYLVGGWNYPIDSHFTHVLVDLEEELSQTLQRHIICTIVDGEAGGLPIGKRYAEAGRSYISVLSGQHNHRLAEFVLAGDWAPVVDDPNREAVFASWANAEKASRDPRQFVLLRPIGQTEPTRIYTVLLFDPIPAAVVPWLHRRRWPYNELRIRELVNGANLNENYGYTYDQVPHRTRQREWEKAQAKVEITQRKLSQHQEAIHNLRHQLKQLQGNYDQQCVVLKRRIVIQRRELRQRQQLTQPTKRCHNCLQRLRKEQADCKTRFLKRQRHLLSSLHRHRTHSRQLRRQLVERITARDTIDTETLCRERHLEKDQIMLNFQVLLGNLHDWVKQHYFAPQWRRLTLDKATKMIYRKSGRVTWYQDRIEVVLDPYAYHDQQRAMETTCQRFNAAHLRWRDGRLLRITVRRQD
ncbi:MAG: hypothetical protein GY832_21360 [Chloroflexi bacterium]|nr:hypothetical protein [Chloroflexota bacterium]